MLASGPQGRPDTLINANGDRSEAKYQTPSSTFRYGYGDYVSVGNPSSPSRVFRTMNVLDTSDSYTSEEFHYLFDSSGRILYATFAQTPQSGHSTYTSSYPAATRARAQYTYDPAGRILAIDHGWDTFDSGISSPEIPYDTTYIVGNACSYELSGSNRGLKTASAFYGSNTTASRPSPSWTESYGYDSYSDYLTSASYGDGQPNATQSWTYDAAGNRTSDYTGTTWAYDNLNRMTASPGFTYSNSILGNRTATIPTTGGAGAMTWDVLNRMLTSTQADPGGASSTASMAYVYRADGMRVKKTLHSGVYELGVTLSGTNEVDDVYTKYRYDGQMPIQTYVNKADSTTLETDQALGARGTDRVSLTNSSGTFISYPLYDAHGNEVLTLAKSGSSYTTGHARSYGAWGEVRQGDTTGGPRARYCGNLGHVQDDETGLIYMRARYYDPASGRFVSEDPGGSRPNLYVYSDNVPCDMVDASGRDAFSNALIASIALLLAGCITLGIGFRISADSVAAYEYGASLESQSTWVERGIKSGELDAGYMETAKDLTLKALAQFGKSDVLAGNAGVVKSCGYAGIAGGIAALIGYSLIVAAFEIDADNATEPGPSMLDIIQFD